MSANRLPPRRKPPKFLHSGATDIVLWEVVGEWADKHKLSAVEERVMMTAVTRGITSRAEIGRIVKTHPDTIKCHIRAILRRTGASNMERLTMYVLMDALHRLLLE